MLFRSGAISLTGVKLRDSEPLVRKAIAKLYKDFQLSVTLFGIRGITVYVVGHAKRPGSYLLSGVSTLASGLMATGGPGSNGSVRRVQLKRSGKTIREFDLYKFLSQGENTGDIKLIDGDTIDLRVDVGFQTRRDVRLEINQTATLNFTLSPATTSTSAGGSRRAAGRSDSRRRRSSGITIARRSRRTGVSRSGTAKARPG